MPKRFVEERELVPYFPSSIPREDPWLIVAPHPDDETIGMGGSILKAVCSGITVYVTFVTSGDKQGNPDEREEEARKALSILGVQQKNLFFLRFPDRKLSLRQPSLRLRLENLLYTLKPGALFATSPMEYHPDHRVVAAVSLLIARQKNLPLFFYEVIRQSEINMLIPLSEEEMEAKKKALKEYKSQLFAGYLSHMEALNHTRTITIPSHPYAEGLYDCRQGLHPCLKWYIEASSPIRP